MNSSQINLAQPNREILILLREGDCDAFYNLYVRYSKRLYGFVFMLIKQEADAEEIVQEVFIKVWEGRNRIDLSSSFESFLFTIAHNSAISLFRKRVSEKKYFDYLRSLQQFDRAPDLIDEIHFNELKLKVQSLINELTPRQKEIFQLSREEGQTQDEIAKKLNVSVNTVKKHMVNALAFLKTGIGGVRCQ